MTELAQVDAKLAEAAARLKTGRTIAEVESAAPDLAAMFDTKAGPLSYSIIRRSEQGMQQIAATEATPVEPGDTIEVKRAGNGGAQTAAGSGTSVDATPPAPPKAPAPKLVAPPAPAKGQTGR
jgi:hypothetical protein